MKINKNDTKFNGNFEWMKCKRMKILILFFSFYLQRFLYGCNDSLNILRDLFVSSSVRCTITGRAVCAQIPSNQSNILFAAGACKPCRCMCVRVNEIVPLLSW